jgi:hypothetical protein
MSVRGRGGCRKTRGGPRHRVAAGAAFGAILLLVLFAIFLPGRAEALPYAVGHRAVTYTDPARSNRSIATEIYYPADAAGDNVPVAEGAFPVVAFGHGYLIVWSAYEYLWTGLAQAGYIVAFPKTEGSLFPSHGEFGKDLAFLVGKLQAEGTSPSSPFYLKVGTTSAALGHSMGGGASFLAMEENPSITALANLAAAETNPSAIAAAAGITAPALLFSGSSDCVTPPAQHQIPMYDALASDCKTRVTITGASHCQFAESNLTCSLGEGSCPAPGITREQQHVLTLQPLRPWLDFFLKGDAAGWTEFQDLIAAGSGITSTQSCAVAGADPAGGSAGRPSLSLACLPNPFRKGTAILIDPAPRGEPSLAIYDLTGRVVRWLSGGEIMDGRWRMVWDGCNDAGAPVAPGVYFCRITAEDAAASTAVVRLR